MVPLASPPDVWRTLRCTYAAGLVFPRGHALRIARSVAAALAGLHRAKVVHGDVYAHNILYDRATGGWRLRPRPGFWTAGPC